jgi:hypothetical protein
LTLAATRALLHCLRHPMRLHSGSDRDDPATRRVARAIVLATLLGGLVAAPALASDEAPRLPCGVAPVPAYAEPGAAPNLKTWIGVAARDWLPPACTGWPRVGAETMVALAGSFRHDGDIDALLARIGAISEKKGVRYWSTTEKAWKALVTDAFALSGPDLALRRADFAAAHITQGQDLHYAQSDNRSSGKTVYRERVLALERERLFVVSENLSPVKMAMFTLYAPGDLQTAYFVERRSPGVWNFYSLTRTRAASSMMPTGGEASYINRAVAFYRFVAGIPTDQEPPAAR